MTETIDTARALTRLIGRNHLGAAEMQALMREIMRGEVPPAVLGGLLIGLRVNGETAVEIAAAAQVMREFAARVEVVNPASLVDIVGTGGDQSMSFNVSTAAMFVAAAAGARVAKHGNRSVSSKSGSADVLEALGAAIELPPVAVAKSIEQTGIGFMFAPIHHPAMRHVAAVRRELGVRTIFNILGPLTNPAGARRILLGVFNGELVSTLARVLVELGVQRALVVHGRDGLDEISLGAPSLVAEVSGDQINEYEIEPEDYGIEPVELKRLAVTGPAESRQMLLESLEGRFEPGRDIVAINAGGALFAAGLAPSLVAGFELARTVIESGAARAKVDEFVSATQRLAKEHG